VGELAARHRVALSGAAAAQAPDAGDDVLALTGDPVSEAERVTALEAAAAS
jgi:hypothetical protein